MCEIMDNLFLRFKDIYEKANGMTVKKSRIIKGVLTVKVYKDNRYMFWLHVVERGGCISWY
ncbi:hypothetical protein [Clostridium sp. BJN0001]|uniref:hypothetical protein n=1 Tax=Clostridium sp. BJN0001 TaxID=2930219 RepID=UPI001FCFC560|nr:hypothetical protein [Clostridium sp. BJN0001]